MSSPWSSCWDVIWRDVFLVDIVRVLVIKGAFLGFFLDGVSGSEEVEASIWGGADRLTGSVIGVKGV